MLEEKVYIIDWLTGGSLGAVMKANTRKQQT